MYPMTDFLTGYVVLAGAGLAGDPGLKASRHSTGGALSVLETSIGAGPPLHVHDREDECFYYFRLINNASTDEERNQIGAQYGIRAVAE